MKLKLSAQFKAILKTEDEEKIKDFVDSRSDCLCYTLGFGGGPKCFHHLFAKSEHKRIEDAVKVYTEIEAILNEHGHEF